MSSIEAYIFYKEAIELLNLNKIPFLVGGGIAMSQYTGIQKDRKDLDIFCKPTEFPTILKFFADQGYQTELTDVRWLAKVFKEEHYIDIIFDTVNNICRVDDSWYDNATDGSFEGVPVKLVPAEELVWCKLYVQNRERHDSADVNHIILKYGKNLDWKRVLFRMDPHWHLLLAQLLIFQFVYPSDYHDIIPEPMFKELLRRAEEQYQLPASQEKVCRGPVIDQTQYSIDIKEWDYKVSTIKTT